MGLAWMITKELLEMLRCPDSRQPLREAESGLVEKANALIAEGKLRNRAGETMERPIEGALVREDGRVMYPVVDGIPIMLVDEAIDMELLRS